MEVPDILNAIEHGFETSKVQFKVNINHINQLAQEMVAFSNTLGGLLIIGVTDKGGIQGLSPDEIRKINQWVGNAATELIKPPISPITQVIQTKGKDILVIEVLKGINNPYYTNEGIAYIKKGSDKRIAPPEEIMRMFQNSGKIYAEETVILKSSIQDIDIEIFKSFIKKKTEKGLEELEQPLHQLLNNMGFAEDNSLTLAGLLLFGKNPQRFKPVFTVQCISFVGNEISGSEYRDSEPPFEGSIPVLLEKTMSFIVRNLHKVQKEESFNSLGQLEIPSKALEELVVNALIHRDYYISSSIKVFIFDNRIEIITPGRLPNTLTVERIKSGTSIARNPTLFSNARFLLPYTGVGSGIPRALKIYPHIELINDVEKEVFVVDIKRGEVY